MTITILRLQDLALSGAIVCCSATPTAVDSLSGPVIYVMGQSNAAYNSANPDQAILMNGPDLLTFDGTTWGMAHAEISGEEPNRFGLGPGSAKFARILLDRSIRASRQGSVKISSGSPIGRVINRGKSGTVVAQHVPGGALYDNALSDWNKSGYAPGIALWIQGESDNVTPGSAYEADLKKVVRGWRSAWGKDLAVVILLIPVGACFGTDNSQIRAAQAAVAASENCLLVNVDTYAKYPTAHPELYDSCHWTESGYELLGETMAKAVP